MKRRHLTIQMGKIIHCHNVMLLKRVSHFHFSRLTKSTMDFISSRSVKHFIQLMHYKEVLKYHNTVLPCFFFFFENIPSWYSFKIIQRTIKVYCKMNIVIILCNSIYQSTLELLIQYFTPPQYH